MLARLYEPAFLFKPTDQLATTFTLPQNVERAYLDVIAQSQSNDEFWYTCVPNDVTGELQSCGATAFRETEVTVDGQPAGVAPVSTPIRFQILWRSKTSGPNTGAAST